MWDQFVKAVVYYGMPTVTAYHLITSSVFLNTAAQDATGFERAGNKVLTPVHYLLSGKIAVNENGSYYLKQHFDYNTDLALKSTISVISAPLSLPLGCLLKGIGYLSHETRARHAKVMQFVDSREVRPNTALYEKLGIPLSPAIVGFEEAPLHVRRPGEESKLSTEKALLKEIARLFNEKQIPFWLDCGTCLGAYRYGGTIPWDKDVDIAILMPDFHNALNALKELDPEKYQVQDWSNRCHPETYLRVLVKENRNHIDVYHYTIDPENKTLTYFVSFMDSNFMTTGWKTYESRFTNPTAYETIFPLRKVLFDGIEVCVPNKTKSYLQERYGEDIGPIKVYNESTGEYEKDLTHPYWQRSHVY